MPKNNIANNPESFAKEEDKKPEEKSIDDFLNELLLEQLEQS